MKRKSPEMVKKTISIEKAQLEWLEKKKFDLSKLTRAYLDELIASMEKTKKAVVPAWIKMASPESLKSRAQKNPVIRRILEE
jgi:hypothetical protein